MCRKKPPDYLRGELKKAKAESMLPEDGPRTVYQPQRDAETEASVPALALGVGRTDSPRVLLGPLRLQVECE